MAGSRWVWAAAVAGALGVGLVEAAPAEKTVSRFKGLEGYATFSVASDCGYPYFDVYAVDEMSAQGPGQPEQNHYMALFYSTYDSCAMESIYVYGEATDALIQGSAVRSLHGEATIPVQVCTDNWVTNVHICVDDVVVLNLDWTASGEESSHGQTTSHMSTPYFSVHSHSVGSSSIADVSGSILLGGTDLLSNVSWSAASISRTREGSIGFVQH
jgi:hypothetical protein